MPVVDAGYVVEVGVSNEGELISRALVRSGGLGMEWGRTYFVYMRVLRSRNVRRLVTVRSIRDSLRKSLAIVTRLLLSPVFGAGLGVPICSSSNHQMIDGA